MTLTTSLVKIWLSSKNNKRILVGSQQTQTKKVILELLPGLSLRKGMTKLRLDLKIKGSREVIRAKRIVP